MRRAAWSRLMRVRVTAGYVLALCVVLAMLEVLGPAFHDRVVQYTSTNLHNLAHGRIETLLASAFVADTDRIYLWLPGLICLLAAAELLWQGRRLAVVFLVGHVGTTVIVAAGLVLAVEQGWLPWSTTRAADVGISYGVMAVTGALSAAVPPRYKPVWLGWWLAAAAAVVMVSPDFADDGHVIALLLGILISTRLDPAVTWTPARCAVFLLGVSFGYGVLLNTVELVPVGLAASVLGAAVVGAVALLMRRRSSL